MRDCVFNKKSNSNGKGAIFEILRLHLEGIFYKDLFVNSSADLFYKQAEHTMKTIIRYIYASYITIVPKECVLR